MTVDPGLIIFAIAMLVFATLASLFLKPVSPRVEMSDEDIENFAREIRKAGSNAYRVVRR